MTEFETGDRVQIVSTSATDPSHGIADGMRGVGDEFTVTEVGTNDYGPYAKGDKDYWWHPDDLEKVTEPEPLKEGDWVQVWARFVREDNLGMLVVATPTGAGGEGCRNTYASPDAIVRPAEGQVPPWLVLPPLEEPKGIGAVVEAELRGSDRHSFVRVDTADGTPCRWRSTYDGCGYEWAALEEPTLTRVGVPEGGAA